MARIFAIFQFVDWLLGSALPTRSGSFGFPQDLGNQGQEFLGFVRFFKVAGRAKAFGGCP
jgi:hypothetical protein